MISIDQLISIAIVIATSDVDSRVAHQHPGVLSFSGTIRSWVRAECR